MFKKVVSAITPDYIQSFELQEPNIALITQYRAITPQTFRELEVDARALTLLTETGGQCLDCGKPLGIKKDGKDISLAVTVKLNEIDDAIFCVECERKNRSMTEEKRLEIIEKKHNLERRAAAMNAIFEAGIDDQIRAVVLAVNQLDLPDDAKEKHDATMVERKVTESLLREKIISYVTDPETDWGDLLALKGSKSAEKTMTMALEELTGKRFKASNIPDSEVE